MIPRGHRIQRSRRKGSVLPIDAIYVGRPTLWGNPFVVGKWGHARCTILHRHWLHGQIGALTLENMGFHPAEIDGLDRKRARILTNLHQLAGKDLACWCPLTSEWCHAETYLAMAPGYAEIERLAAKACRLRVGDFREVTSAPQSVARAKAWETRRQKYGPSGHNGRYWRKACRLRVGDFREVTSAPQSVARAKAWETRRQKYGPSGHNGRYWRNATPKAMLDLIIRLHVEGTLSEGQVARATGLDRVAIRNLADRIT